MKVVLVTNIIAPYRIPMFNAFARKLGKDFSVWFMAENVPDRRWRVEKERIAFSYKVLAGPTVRAWGSYWHINPGFLGNLFREKPQVIVMGGYNSLHYPLAVLYAKCTGCRLVLWSESHFDSSRQNSRMARAVKARLIGAANAFLTPSSRGQDYLVAHGADPRACFRLFNCVEPARFAAKEAGTREYQPPRLLFVGSLDRRKGLSVALAALARLETDWSLTVAGTGPDELRLQEEARQLGIAERVKFLGFVDNEELAAVYRRCNYFILPTFNDPCPLVVNEALAAGLFCILSRRAGNAEEFIVEGKNGVLFDPSDIDEARSKIVEALGAKPSEEVIVDSIEKASPERVSDVFSEALQFVGGMRFPIVSS